LMGSLIDELQRREAAARAEAEGLRGRIAELAGQLAQAEERLSRLVIARETVEEVLEGAATEIAPVSPAAEQPEGTALAGPGRSPVAGVVAVPPWRAGLEVSVLPRDYRDLLEVAEDAGRPLRAGQIAAAAGLPADRGKVETLRSKLKRLAARGWLAEEAGLFALPARNGSGVGEAVKPG
jgi:cell division septum initiation protein DivIVA